MQDRDRPLNPRGINDALRMGAYLARHALEPDLALVSPARRTRETWDALVSAFSTAVPVRYEDRLYDAAPQAISAMLREADPSVGRLLVIGHNPGLHETSRLVIASGDVEARERLNEGLPTAGLAVIDFPGADWKELHPHSGRLERFVTPRLLRAATD